MSLVSASNHSKQTAKHRRLECPSWLIAGISLLALVCGADPMFRAPTLSSNEGSSVRIELGESMFAFYRGIKRHVHHEFEAACAAEIDGHPRLAFSHLERAHVLGQRSTRLHVLAHWRMLEWAVRQRECSEAIGQLWRIIGAAISTGVGWVPVGNTGGTNVSGFQSMPVPADLQAIIDTAHTES
jgi:hypothetical protein